MGRLLHTLTRKNRTEYNLTPKHDQNLPQHQFEIYFFNITAKI